MIEAGVNAPWKVLNHLLRVLAFPGIRLYFAFHGVAWGKGWEIFGLPLVQRYRGSRIAIGDYLQMRNWFTTNPLGVNHRSVLATWAYDAEIEVGHYARLTGTTLCAQTGVYIGDRVRIGANSKVVDTDFHPLDVVERRRDPKAGKSSPIVIEDDVFIGMSALILKGSHIGTGSVIGAGSVVAGEIPAGVVIAGNPARIVREL